MTSRRVIFVDPDHWTQPKEHAMTDPNTASDCRRAMAMITHHTNNFQSGINAIIEEANAADRTTDLLFAILNAYQFIVPELRTKGAMVALSEWVDICAKQKTHPDWAAASELIIGHATEDVDRINRQIIKANNAGRTTQLMVAIFDVYEALLPELYTPAGTGALSQWTARLSGHEDVQ